MDRKPIVLSPNAVALIQTFTKTSDIVEISMVNWEKYCAKESVESAAKEFISQLEGWWTPNFLMALRNEINTVLEEHEKDVADFCNKN